MTGVNPFERLGRFVVRRAWWVVGAWALLLLAALPLAPQVPGALSAGGFILDDLESARAKALLGRRAGPATQRPRHRLPSPTLEAGTPAFEAAAAEADARHPRRAARRPGRPAPARPRARSRRTATRRTTSSSSTCRRTTRPSALPILRERLREAPGLDVELAGGPAFYGDVQAVSEADLQRSELISLPLAALALLLVFGSVVAAGVPLDRRRRGGRRRAGGDLPRRVGHADEHLRAQPRDAAGARAGRRLLAADDEPVPRGAGDRDRDGPDTGRGGGPGHGRTAGRAVFFAA